MIAANPAAGGDAKIDVRPGSAHPPWLLRQIDHFMGDPGNGHSDRDASDRVDVCLAEPLGAHRPALVGLGGR